MPSMLSRNSQRLEYRERGLVAASRRHDRSLEARMKSAYRASFIHEKLTGRRFIITEDAVRNCRDFEEEVVSGSHKLEDNKARTPLAAPSDNRPKSPTRKATTSMSRIDRLQSDEEWRLQQVHQDFSQVYPGVSQAGKGLPEINQNLSAEALDFACQPVPQVDASYRTNSEAVPKASFFGDTVHQLDIPNAICGGSAAAVDLKSADRDPLFDDLHGSELAAAMEDIINESFQDSPLFLPLTATTSFSAYGVESCKVAQSCTNDDQNEEDKIRIDIGDVYKKNPEAQAIDQTAHHGNPGDSEEDSQIQLCLKDNEACDRLWIPEPPKVNDIAVSNTQHREHIDQPTPSRRDRVQDGKGCGEEQSSLSMFQCQQSVSHSPTGQQGLPESVESKKTPMSWLFSHNGVSLARVLDQACIDDDAIHNVFQILANCLGRFRLVCLSSLSTNFERDLDTVNRPKVILPVFDIARKHFAVIVAPKERTSVRIYDSSPALPSFRLAAQKASEMFGRLGIDVDPEMHSSFFSYRAPILQTDDRICGIAVIVTGIYESLDIPVPQGQLHSTLWRHVVWLLLKPLSVEEQHTVQNVEHILKERPHDQMQPNLTLLDSWSFHSETAPLDQALDLWLAHSSTFLSMVEERLNELLEEARLSIPQVFIFEELGRIAIDGLFTYMSQKLNFEGEDSDLYAIRESIVRVYRVTAFLKKRQLEMERMKALRRKIFQIKEVLNK